MICFVEENNFYIKITDFILFLKALKIAKMRQIAHVFHKFSGITDNLLSIIYQSALCLQIIRATALYYYYY